MFSSLTCPGKFHECKAIEIDVLFFDINPRPKKLFFLNSLDGQLFVCEWSYNYFYLKKKNPGHATKTRAMNYSQQMSPNALLLTHPSRKKNPKLAQLLLALSHTGEGALRISVKITQ